MKPSMVMFWVIPWFGSYPGQGTSSYLSLLTIASLVKYRLTSQAPHARICLLTELAQFSPPLVVFRSCSTAVLARIRCGLFLLPSPHQIIVFFNKLYCALPCKRIKYLWAHLIFTGTTMNTEQYRKDFGRRLLNRLYETGTSQDELARRLGVNKASVSCWVNAKNSITVENLIRVADILDVSVMFLIEGREIEIDPVVLEAILSELAALEKTLRLSLTMRDRARLISLTYQQASQNTGQTVQKDYLRSLLELKFL
jgi:transcriptional regulator with XRE-family HTH domain